MRQNRACASMAVAASLCSLVSLQGSQPAADVPFELLEQHLIVVRGSVAGVRDLNLLIDTGTIPSVIDGRIARKLRLHTEPSQVVAFGQTVRAASTTSLTGLRIGMLEPGQIPAAIGDLSYLQQGRVDAIVGLDVLARRSFGIDYRARTLSFGPAGREDAVAPLQVVWPFLAVRLFVSGRPMQLLVDTGSRDLVLFKSRMPAALLPLPWKGDKTILHASGVAHLLRYDLRQVTLGDQHWENLSGFVLDASTASYPPGIDGVLGVRAIGGTQVRFDFERGELGWSK
jgi:predicted aspartyl protease